MTSGSLTDLDPPAARERRWPFYVAWLIGASVVGAVLLNHVPGSVTNSRPAPVAEPAATEAPGMPTSAPAAPRVVNPLPLGSPLRVTIPIAPAPARP